MSQAIKRRIAPSVPLTLDLKDDSGATFKRDFRLSFDFNATALVEERTGLNLLTAEVWTSGLSSRSLSIMLWAAVLAHHPEYAGDEGLEAIRSYMDVGNTDPIHGALWDAYFISLPKEKREALEEAKKKLEAGEKTDPLAMPPEAAKSESLSIGLNSGQSPATTLDSASKSSAA